MTAPAAFRLTVTFGNEAMPADDPQPLADLLRYVADRIEDRGPGYVGYTFPVRDTNGNTIGTAAYLHAADAR